MKPALAFALALIGVTACLSTIGVAIPVAFTAALIVLAIRIPGK